MKRLFLYRVYLFHKGLFIFFSSFALLTLLGNLAGDEITPFFVWGMYSEKEKPKESYPILRITANDQVVDYTAGFLPKNRFFLDWPLTYYSEIRDQKDPTELFLREKLGGRFSLIEPYATKVLNSPADFNEFPKWYKRYLEQSTGKIIHDLKVEVLQATYDANQVIHIHPGYILFHEK